MQNTSQQSSIETTTARWWCKAQELEHRLASAKTHALWQVGQLLLQLLGCWWRPRLNHFSSHGRLSSWLCFRNLGHAAAVVLVASNSVGSQDALQLYATSLELTAVQLPTWSILVQGECSLTCMNTVMYRNFSARAALPLPRCHFAASETHKQGPNTHRIEYDACSATLAAPRRTE